MEPFSMNDEYVLCSSSTEQGELPVISVKRLKNEDIQLFPRCKSQLTFMYLPGTQLFIGHNTIPKSCDYQQSMSTAGLERVLRKTQPYLFSCVKLNADKAFFGNKFSVDSSVNFARKKEHLELVCTKENLVDITQEQGTLHETWGDVGLRHIKDAQENKYEDICRDFLSRELFETLRVEHKKVNIIVNDSMLDNLWCKEVYTHLVVKEIDKTVYVVFDGQYFLKTGYYALLRRYGKEALTALNSSEVRVYANQSILIAVYSSTVFRDPSGVQRLFGGMDVYKSVDVAVSLDSVRLVKYPGEKSDGFSIILGIEFKDGEYAINGGKIYKKDLNGKRHTFCGLSFADLLEENAA